LYLRQKARIKVLLKSTRVRPDGAPSGRVLFVPECAGQWNNLPAAGSQALGPVGKAAAPALYDGTMEPESYYQGYMQSYFAGRNNQRRTPPWPLTGEQYKQAFRAGTLDAKEGKRPGVDMEKVRSDYAASLNMDQKPAAYSAGQKNGASDAAISKNAAATLAEMGNGDYTGNNKRRTDYGAEEVYLRKGGKWNDRSDTSGPVRKLEESAGRNPGWNLAGRPADGEVSSLSYGKAVSTASLGISGGSTNDRIYLVTGGETEATQAAKSIAKERGLHLTLFVGGNLSIQQEGGQTASVRAYISGNRVFVRADHGEYTADQLMRHEAGHDRIARGEIDPDEVRARIIGTYGMEKVAELSGMYEAAYRGSKLTPDEVWEEVICDSLGDMNIFHDIPNLEGNAQRLLDDTKAAVSTEIEANRTRGPPTASRSGDGKASREYWRPNLTRDQWSAITAARDTQLGMESHRIGEIEAWVYTEKNGHPVFAIYSTEDMDDPTMLYACTGKTAVSMHEIISKITEGNKNGFDATAKNFAESFTTVRRFLSKYGRNMRGTSGGRATNRPGGVASGKPGRERGGDPRAGEEDQTGHGGEDGLTGKASRELPVEQDGLRQENERLRTNMFEEVAGQNNQGRGAIEVRDSEKEGTEHGNRGRKESRVEFISRSNGRTRTVREIGGVEVAYGEVGPFDTSFHAEKAGGELRKLGIKFLYHDGLEYNENGVTYTERGEAASIGGEEVCIYRKASSDGKLIAGHAAFHIWYSNNRAEEYKSVFRENIDLFSDYWYEQYLIVVKKYGNDRRLIQEEFFARINGRFIPGCTRANCGRCSKITMQ
jgi:hypothetical protein